MSHLEKEKFFKDLKICRYVKGTQCKSFNDFLQVKFVKTTREISKAAEVFVNFKLLPEPFQDYKTNL